MCILSTEIMQQLSGSVVLKLHCILQRQSLFINKQQLKDLKKDEFDHYMDVRSACIHYIKASYVHFKTKPDTFTTAINILDVFLWKVKVTERHMSIVSVACFFIAAKMLESDEECPSSQQLAGLHEWTAKDLRRMELHILDKLDWSVTTVSYLDFLPLFALIYGVSINQMCCDAVTTLAERCLAKQSTVLMQPGVLALSLLHHVTAEELQSSYVSQALIYCNIQESELEQCKQILSYLSSSTYTSTNVSPTRPRFPMKVFDRPSEMGVTCLPTILEEPSS